MINALPPSSDIVIVAPMLPDDQLWEQISIFKNVFFMQGSPLKFADLVRAGVERADTVLVLASSTNTNAKDDFMIDSETILSYMLIEAIVPNIKILVELGTLRLYFNVL